MFLQIGLHPTKYVCDVYAKVLQVLICSLCKHACLSVLLNKQTRTATCAEKTLSVAVVRWSTDAKSAVLVATISKQCIATTSATEAARDGRTHWQTTILHMHQLVTMTACALPSCVDDPVAPPPPGDLLVRRHHH